MRLLLKMHVQQSFAEAHFGMSKRTDCNVLLTNEATGIEATTMPAGSHAHGSGACYACTCPLDRREERVS